MSSCALGGAEASARRSDRDCIAGATLVAGLRVHNVDEVPDEMFPKGPVIGRGTPSPPAPVMIARPKKQIRLKKGR